MTPVQNQHIRTALSKIMNAHRSSSFHMASKIMILHCLCWPQVFAKDNPSAEKVAQIQQAAKQGDADSQAQLADIYRYGKGVKIDYKESFLWANKAADQGHAHAQHYLGICYTYGMGVEKDPTAAFKWFQKSAAQGYTAAVYRLGMCYHDGEGVPKDDQKAIALLEASANSGDAEAMMELASIYYKRSQSQKNEYEKSLDFYKIDYIYRDSRREAYKWCNLAASAGSARAKKNLKILSDIMSVEDIECAQKMSSEWKPKP